MKKYICLFIIFMFIFIGKINAYISFNVGETVSYNGIDFYVIKDSDSSDSTLKLLKAEPIKSAEIKGYLSATEVASKVDITEKYIKMAYYARDNCVSAGDISGCSTDYKVSDVKQVIDVWVSNYVNLNDLELDYTGFSSRLLTIDDLKNSLGYQYIEKGTSMVYKSTESTPQWLYDVDYNYYTMSPNEDSDSSVWAFFGNNSMGELISLSVGKSTNNVSSVRPVITLKKTALGDAEEIIDNKVDKKDITEKDNSVTKVDVSNTYLKKSLIIIIFGFIIACVSLVIYYIIKKKYSERK